MKSRSFAFRAHENPDDRQLAELYADLGESAVLTPFQEQGFVAAFYSNLPDDCTPVLVEVKDAASGRAVMLLPLVKRRTWGVSHIEAADRGVSDYVAPLVAEWFQPRTEEMGTIWRELKTIFRRADVLSFGKVPARIGGGRVNPLALIPGSVPMGVTTRILDLSDQNSPDHYRRSGIYKDGLRRFRKLGDYGTVEFRLATTREEALELFGHLVDQRLERFAELDRDEPLAVPATRGFYREMIADGVPAGRVMFGGLYLDGVCIATDMGLLHRETHHGIFTSMRMGELSRFSPGTIAFMLILDATAARGIRYYDIGVGDFAYKGRLKGGSTPLYERHEALTLRGGVVLAGLGMRRMIRHGLTHYPSLRPTAEALRQKVRRFAGWSAASLAVLTLEDHPLLRTAAYSAGLA